MSGLVEKVKEKVRTRSRSRKSAGRNELRNSEDLNRSSFTQPRSSHDIQDQDHAQRSPGTQAWHVHKGSRQSIDEPQISSPNIAHGDSNGYTISSQSPVSRDTSDVGMRSTSNHSTSIAQNSVPKRVDSLPQRKPVQSGENGYNEKRLSQRFNNLSVASNGTRSTTQTGGSEHSQAVKSEMVPLPLEPKRQNPTSPRSRKKSAALQLSEHMRLPSGFDLSNSERTVVDTAWMPAVTHENVHHDRTEIIQEAISKDIHVHHYYTYIQPIKVVEVLPTRHYRLDEKTGQKIEIEAPAGWQLPVSMNTHQPDTTALKGTTRHYLVNEEYPRGIIEPPPHDNDERSGPVGLHSRERITR